VQLTGVREGLEIARLDQLRPGYRKGLDMIVVIASTTVEVPADRDRLLAALAVATMPTLREPGVLEYRTWATAHDPCVVHSVAIFTSA
jgi:hypothetical protein